MSDYISRADAIEAVASITMSIHLSGVICDRIKALPSADAEQETVPTVVRVTMSDGSQYYLEHECDALQAEAVQGEWIRKEKEENDCDGYRAWYWYECSVCGARPPKDTWKNEWHSDYCPSCGAYMTHKESE